MRVNIYAEEMTDKVEIIGKEIEGYTFTGLRFYLELPATVGGQQYQGPFMHRPGDDDSSAVTFWGKRDLRALLRKSLALLDAHYGDAATDLEQTIHPDDLAVDLFASAMKAKLEFARNKRGRGGLDDKAECTAEHLSDLLRGHIIKGNPTDVANFACFLWNRGEGITPAQPVEGHGATKDLPFFKDEAALISFLDNLYEMDSAGAVEGDKWEPAQRAIAGIRGRQDAAPAAYIFSTENAGERALVFSDNIAPYPTSKYCIATPLYTTPPPAIDLLQFKDAVQFWRDESDYGSPARSKADRLLALIAEQEARNG